MTLEGRQVRLEPLDERHAEGLARAGADPRIWEFMTRGPIGTPDVARAYVAEMKARADTVAFATVLVATGDVVGSTTYMDIQPAPRGLEIGRTWLNPAHWRSPANTEAKYLMLRHAFEALGANRVCLKTDARNLRSQRAIERIGAVKEGVLRKHMLAQDGHLRDSVYYAILAAEWPAAKARLEAAMAARG